jgi:hypothetical protein
MRRHIRSKKESLGTVRAIIMAIVGVVILIAFVVSRLHLRDWFRAFGSR